MSATRFSPKALDLLEHLRSAYALRLDRLKHDRRRAETPAISPERPVTAGDDETIDARTDGAGVLDPAQASTATPFPNLCSRCNPPPTGADLNRTLDTTHHNDEA